MKIALINPPFLFPVKFDMVYSHCIGLRTLSALLKREGHTVCFIDALMMGFNRVKPYRNGWLVGAGEDEIAGLIPVDTDIIGISVPFSHLAPIAHRFCESLKKHFPGPLLVMGGVYPSTQPGMAITSAADYIVVGEGERPLAEMAAGKAPASIPGVYPCREQAGASFKPAETENHLDNLPFPDDGIPMMERYFTISQRRNRGRTSTLVTSRGCPYDCEFCSIHPVCGKKWRARSAGHVLEEIAYLAHRYGIRLFEIEDDNFTLDKKRLIEILEGITRLKERNAGLSWNTPNGVRIDTLDGDMIRLIKRSGCRQLTLALEHGDPEMLKLMNKYLDLEKAFSVIKQVVENKIAMKLFVITGYPGETGGHFEKGKEFLKRIKGLRGDIFLAVSMAQVYPGTRLYQRCVREGWIDEKEFVDFQVKGRLMNTTYFPGITTGDFSGKEIKQRKNRLRNMFTPAWKVVLRRVLPSSLWEKIFGYPK